ncbi:MAG: response regulator transcription factor [Phycisphaerae bacterium]|jgi:DNA-binding NarL/FixJ family response regulator|nr:response regulator transcription factor [Phycisphaerae bacterium]
MGDNSITVFLADDHQVLRDGLVLLLETDPNITVAGHCQNGLEVVPFVEELKPDVVLLDITLPGLSGIDICKDLSQKTPDTAVIMLTIHRHDEFVIEALENGAIGYLLKEGAADEVITAIHAAVRGELYLASGVNKNVLSRLNKGDSNPYKQLTSREKQVFHLIVDGKTSRQIAQELSITPKTVDAHRNNLMQKLDIHKQTELVRYAIRRGIITLD